MNWEDPVSWCCSGNHKHRPQWKGHISQCSSTTLRNEIFYLHFLEGASLVQTVSKTSDLFKYFALDADFASLFTKV